jgi:vacuolar-type H+-ATPase subunit F/Vma7
MYVADGVEVVLEPTRAQMTPEQVRAFAIAISDTGKADIFLVTDGEIEGIDEVIEVAMNSKHRIFVVAIGSSPAEGQLRRLATETGGYCDFVAPGETVEPAIMGILELAQRSLSSYLLRLSTGRTRSTCRASVVHEAGAAHTCVHNQLG